MPQDAVAAPVILKGEDCKDCLAWEEKSPGNQTYSCRTMEA